MLLMSHPAPAQHVRAEVTHGEKGLPGYLTGGEGLNNPVNQHFCEPKMMTFVPRGEIFNVTSSSDG